MNDMERLFISYGLLHYGQREEVVRYRLTIPVEFFDSVDNGGVLAPYFRRVDCANSGRDLRNILSDFAQATVINRTYSVVFHRRDGTTVERHVKASGPLKTKIYQQTIPLPPDEAKLCAKRLLTAMAQIDDLITNGELSNLIDNDPDHVDRKGKVKHAGSKFLYSQRELSLDGKSFRAMAQLMFTLSGVDVVKQISVEGGATFKERVEKIKMGIATDGEVIDIEIKRHC